MIITYKRSIDLANRVPSAPIEAVQDDCGRVLALFLRANGVPWQIPAGVSAIAHYTKADGIGGSYDTLPDGSCAWSAEGNVLRLCLAPQMLTCPGKVRMSIQLTDGQNCIHTFEQQLQVLPKLPQGQTESEAFHKINAYLTAPTAAAVGQFLRVLDVDTTGRVVALETAEAAGSSGIRLVGQKLLQGQISSIVLLGDSITDGAGGSDYNGSFTGDFSTNTAGYCWANAFAKFITERYGIPVRNMGMYGTVMAAQKEAILDQLSETDYVIWLTGTNDRWDPSSYRQNLLSNVRTVQERCAGVLVLSNVPATAADEAEKPVSMQKMDEIILGQLVGAVPVFSMYQAFLQQCDQMNILLSNCFQDGVHPNDLGYYLMFRALCSGLGLPLDPYTDYRYSGSWWGGSQSGGETVEDTLLLDSTDDYGATPTDFVYLLEEIVPVVLMDGYDSSAKTTALSGKTVTRVVLDVREAGAITFGTVDLNNVGSASPAFTQTATITTAATGFVEFTLNMEVGANETLAFQQLSDTGHLGFICMSGDLFIWQSKDFIAGSKSTDLILYGKIYTA